MKKNVLGFFRFASSTLVSFSISILILTVMSALFGEEITEYSALFRLGSTGVSNASIWQVLLCTSILNLWSLACSTDYMARRFLLLWRMVFVLCGATAITVAFIAAFDWFPFNLPSAWAGFFLSFGICFLCSTVIMVIKTKLEGRRYDHLLEKYKQDRERADKQKQGGVVHETDSDRSYL